MGKLCTIMQHITFCTPCFAFILVSHPCIFVIGHAEKGPEETSDPAQAEGINPEQDQGKPGASNHHPSVYFTHLCLNYDS
jgi:hypothetical protein